MAAEIYMETGKTPLGLQLLEDMGDRRTFGLAAAELWAAMALEDVRANGIIAGVNMGTPAASGLVDACDVAAVVAMLLGVSTPVAADSDIIITRPLTAVAKVNSFTVTDAGVIAVVAGLDSLSAAFSLVRGAPGGPPLIPVDAIELFQVKVTDDSPSVITLAQIVHTTEFAETFQINAIGLGDHSKIATRRRAHVYFGRELPLIHTGPATRRVYAEISEPQKTLVAKTKDFKGAEKTASASTSQFYDEVENDVTYGLGTAGFNTKLVNGVSDMILASRGENRTFWFYPDKDKTDHTLTQGVVTVARTWDVSGSTMGAVAIVAQRETVEIFID